MADFQDTLQNPEAQPPSNEEIIKAIDTDNEKEYYAELKKKNKNFLLRGLDLLERERIAQYICDRYYEVIDKHREKCDKMDEWDDVYRMVRDTFDEDMPNYRSPLSTTTLEVVHANIMNVFFTPKDLMRVIPTEENDISKVKKLSVFGNWSLDNEMNVFENCDRLFHSSDKNGECPYIVHWVKEYGTEIKREILYNPANPTEPLIDPDTQEPLYQEVEKVKLLYNGPKLEVFSRKDYLQPLNARMDKLPDWEMRIVRKTYDDYLREELQGKMYEGTVHELKGWGAELETIDREDFDGDQVPLGEHEKEFVEFYGKLRIKLIKENKESEFDDYEELEDEFIAIVNVSDNVLCSLRKNKFPLKLRPLGMDYCIPDDEGRREAMGIMEFMDGPQKAYDRLFNQYIFGTVQANNPFGFFSPMGNQRNEPLKIKNGYLFPTSDPNSVNIVKLPPPDSSLQTVLELITYWSQMLFGISDYAMGMESSIDPSAPAKKAEIVVAQGSVRLNMLIKRKNKTLQDIFKRWFLLYQANMPPNKYMRIAGDSEDNPWKFDAVSISDFGLNSIPDFELTGNILNVNKSLEANKALAIYNVFIANPFFSPQTMQGLQALHSLTKWLADKLDETGLSRFLPAVPGVVMDTPEEENAKFLQGDDIKPFEQEDHVQHIKVHNQLLLDPAVPEEIRQKVAKHISEHVKMLQQMVTQQMVLSQLPQGGQPMNPLQQNAGGQNGFAGKATPRPANPAQGVFQGQPSGMAGY